MCSRPQEGPRLCIWAQRGPCAGQDVGLGVLRAPQLSLLTAGGCMAATEHLKAPSPEESLQMSRPPTPAHGELTGGMGGESPSAFSKQDMGCFHAHGRTPSLWQVEGPFCGCPALAPLQKCLQLGLAENLSGLLEPEMLATAAWPWFCGPGAASFLQLRDEGAGFVVGSAWPRPPGFF